jgi:hypothetical protein
LRVVLTQKPFGEASLARQQLVFNVGCKTEFLTPV